MGKISKSQSLNPKELQKARGEDHIFVAPESKSGDFKFDSKVASVFDDMVTRSVPLYGEMQRMACELAAYFAVQGTQLYDIGCATGTTLDEMHKTLDPSVGFVGIDNSYDMLKQAEEKLQPVKAGRPLVLEYGDVNGNINIQNASVVVMILTLQFVRPLNRERLMKQIYEGINPSGCLILLEKVISEDSLINRLFIEKYYNHKRRQGYSDTEIAHKREALENVLIPYRMDENFALLHHAGFKNLDVFFRWYNFCGILAVK